MSGWSGPGLLLPAGWRGRVSGSASSPLSPTPQEHRHHRGLLCASGGTAGDHLPDGERPGWLPWARAEHPCRVSQPGALACAQVIGHRTWVQSLTLPHGLGDLERAQGASVFSSAKWGRSVTVTAPSPACCGVYATRIIGLCRPWFLFLFLWAVMQDPLSWSCPVILGST